MEKNFFKVWSLFWMGFLFLKTFFIFLIFHFFIFLFFLFFIFLFFIFFIFYFFIFIFLFFYFLFFHFLFFIFYFLFFIFYFFDDVITHPPHLPHFFLFLPHPPLPSFFLSFPPPTPPFFFLLPCRRWPEPFPTLSEVPSWLRKIWSQEAHDVRLMSLFELFLDLMSSISRPTIFNNQPFSEQLSKDFPKMLSTNQKPGNR